MVWITNPLLKFDGVSLGRKGKETIEWLDGGGE